MNRRGLSLGPTRRCNEPRPAPMTSSQHIYEVRPRKDKRGFDLISDALPFGRLVVRRGQTQSRMQSDTRSSPGAYENTGAATTKGCSLDETSRTPAKGFHEIRSATLG